MLFFGGVGGIRWAQGPSSIGLVLVNAHLSRDILKYILVLSDRLAGSSFPPLFLIKKWSRRDSNPLPPRCKRGALPIELRPQKIFLLYFLITCPVDTGPLYSHLGGKLQPQIKLRPPTNIRIKVS